MEIMKKKIEEIIETDYEVDNVDLTEDYKEESTTPAAEEAIEEEKATETKESKAEVDNSPIAIPGTDVTENRLKELKETYRKLYQTEFDDDIFIWHALSRNEFTNIVNKTAEIEDDELRIIEREKLFVKAACIFPSADSKEMDTFIKDEDVMTTTLSNEILQRSGFVAPKTKRL